VFMLTSCSSTAPKHFSTQFNQPIAHIAIANIDYDYKIDIRQENALFMMLGSTGMMLKQVAMESNKQSYMAENEALGQECALRLRQLLRQQLRSHGYQVHESNMDYWHTMRYLHQAKVEQANPKRRVDAVLRVQIKHLGYWSSSYDHPYQPAAMLVVSLVSPINKKIFFSKNIAIADTKSAAYTQIINKQWVDLLSGKIPEKFIYHNVYHLLDHAQQSSHGLHHIIHIAAKHISDAIKPDQQLVMNQARE
ncbi:MAG: hypothetical protein HQM07_09315, partial [Zetaproteobacteria bacterium]|nr:hypothetical protein [Zetaproteobacteria bacterium]